MPRQARIDAPGALHHIIARGIERRRIFRNKKDYADFLGRLAALVVENRTDCYAWALMPNHFHLLLKSDVVPIATLMRRLLTGYAVSFNHRHGRNGHVFQNRYKSILCQEDVYFKELVRYIHLNPLRAGLVADLPALSRYAFAGHGVLAGDQANDWQNSAAVLQVFGAKAARARERYRLFVQEGVEQGKRPELTGGGMIRSLGGWTVVKGLGKEQELRKGDERILGDSDFVEETLRQAAEGWRREHRLLAKGVELSHVLLAVAELLEVKAEEITKPGKERQRVRARSLLCYWAVRELGMTMSGMSRQLGLSVPAIAMAVRRGAAIAHDNGYSLQKALKF